MRDLVTSHRRVHLRRCALLLAVILLPAPVFSSLGSLGLRAAPEVIRADGHSTTTVTAEVRDSGGSIVPDGTEVHFTTTSGRIDPSVPTIAGRARATLTSDALPGVAQVSAFSGASSATISVRMVEDPQAQGPVARAMTLDGKYVAYSESRGILEAIGEASLTWKGQRITSRSVQVDLFNNVIRAWGSVTVEARDRKKRGGEGARGRGGEGHRADHRGAATGAASGRAEAASGGADAATGAGNGASAATSGIGGANDSTSGATEADAPGPPDGMAEGEQDIGTRPVAPPPRPPIADSAPSPDVCGPACPVGQHLHGERFAVDTLSDQATLLTADARQVFDYGSLKALAGAQTAPDPLEWADLTDSDMLWKADRVIAVPGQKVQLRKATAYIGGQRILHLPYHEVSLEEGISAQGQQYFGVGNEGLMVDLPYYVGMSADASTSLRLRHGSRTGFGWYGTDPGWQLDLERRYGLPGANEGVLTLGRVTSNDWGLHWHHTQRLAPGTQAYALVEYPAHQDLYTNLNLSRAGRQGSLGLSVSAHKLQNRSFGRTLNLNAQTTPRKLGETGLKLTLESRLYDSRGGHFVAFNGERYEVEPSYSRELGLRLTPATLKLGRGGLSSWLSLKQVWGSQDRSGFGLAGSAAFNHSIGRTGGVSLNYSYNRFPGNTFYGRAGRQNLSGSLRMTPTPRLFLAAFGSVGLDSPTRTMSATAAYSFGPLWRLEVQQTAYHFRTLQEADLQLGLTRVIGPRELTVYWSRLRHRIMFQIGGGGF